MSLRVLMAIPLGPGKEYMLPHLLKIARSIEGVDHIRFVFDCILPVHFVEDFGPGESYEIIPTPRLDSAFGNVARARERLRQFAIEGGWSHVYWHDADMLPPTDVVGQLLLAGDGKLSTGTYLIRGYSVPIMPIVKAEEANIDLANITRMADASLMRSKEKVIQAKCYGFGCMLTACSILKKTPFRPAEFWEQGPAYGEDYQWMIDAGRNANVVVDCAVWHFDSNNGGDGTRIRFGELRPAITWTGDPARVSNKYGGFIQGVPRFDLPAQAAEDLSGDFLVEYVREPIVEKGNVKELLK